MDEALTEEVRLSMPLEVTDTHPEELTDAEAVSLKVKVCVTDCVPVLLGEPEVETQCVGLEEVHMLGLRLLVPDTVPDTVTDGDEDELEHMVPEPDSVSEGEALTLGL